MIEQKKIILLKGNIKSLTNTNNNMEILIFLAINVLISFLIAKAGEKRKIGFGWSFFFCLFLSPIIGGIITMLSPKIIN